MSSFSENERSFWGSWKRSWSQYSRNQGDDWISAHHWSEKSSTVLYAIGTNNGALGFNTETEDDDDVLRETTSMATASLSSLENWIEILKTKKTKSYSKTGMKYIKIEEWKSTQNSALLQKWHCLKFGPRFLSGGPKTAWFSWLTDNTARRFDPHVESITKF